MAQNWCNKTTDDLGVTNKGEKFIKYSRIYGIAIINSPQINL